MSNDELEELIDNWELAHDISADGDIEIWDEAEMINEKP